MSFRSEQDILKFLNSLNRALSLLNFFKQYFLSNVTYTLYLHFFTSLFFLESVKKFVSFSCWKVRRAFLWFGKCFQKANNFQSILLVCCLGDCLKEVTYSLQYFCRVSSMTFRFRKTDNNKLVLKQGLFCSLFPFDQQIFNALSLLHVSQSVLLVSMTPVLVDNLSMKTVIIIPTCRFI